jgi:hypothetical protein
VDPELDEALARLGVSIGEDGGVVLFHATNPAAANEIVAARALVPDEFGHVFFSTDPSIAAAGVFGAGAVAPEPPDVIVPVRVSSVDLIPSARFGGDDDLPPRVDLLVQTSGEPYTPMSVGARSFFDTWPSAPALGDPTR